MDIPDVAAADSALKYLCATRGKMTDAAFYAYADRLLDRRNRATLVARLEAEHAAELAGAR
jgi:hypothetical protein